MRAERTARAAAGQDQAAGHEAGVRPVNHDRPVETRCGVAIDGASRCNHFPTRRRCMQPGIADVLLFHGDSYVGWGYAELAGKCEAAGGHKRERRWSAFAGGSNGHDAVRQGGTFELLDPRRQGPTSSYRYAERATRSPGPLAGPAADGSRQDVLARTTQRARVVVINDGGPMGADRAAQRSPPS